MNDYYDEYDYNRDMETVDSSAWDKGTTMSTEFRYETGRHIRLKFTTKRLIALAHSRKWMSAGTRKVIADHLRDHRRATGDRGYACTHSFINEAFRKRV